jgi:glycosyltransferase involved in cell wall biosynthesis
MGDRTATWEPLLGVGTLMYGRHPGQTFRIRRQPFRSGRPLPGLSSMTMVAQREPGLPNIGIAPGTISTPPMQDGHHRVWKEVTRRLEDFGAIATEGEPDVWFYSGHVGDPDVQGPAVAVVYEVGWSVPGAYDGYPPEFIADIDRATAAGVRRADAVITGSASTKQEVIRAYGYPPEGIHIIPFGVDPHRFRPSSTTPSGAIQIPGLPADRPYVLFISSLAPRKNVSVLRDAVEILAAEGYPHALVMVGAVPPHLQRYDPEAERRALEPLEVDDRVFRLVDLSDDQLASVMTSATALCAPSSHEGFGLTVLEAMAAGVPVVVSDRGSLPEVVGDAGVVVSPTAPAVAAALRGIIDDPQRASSLGQAARRRAETFTWERTALGWIEVASSIPYQTEAS